MKILYAMIVAVIVMSQLCVLAVDSPLQRAKKARDANNEAVEGRKAIIEEKKAATKEKREAAQEALEKRVDKRQDNQARRIEHGIKKGYLTEDEISKLQAQQKSIAVMEESFKSDGKITRDEGKQLILALNEASRCIFAEKHDADGGTMPVYRFGRNVTLKDSVAQKLGDENLTRAEARAYLKDFQRTMELKRLLSTGDLSDTERAKLQAEYNELLNRYFDLKS